jgi:phosphoribosylformylglycinamidine synthase
MDYEKRVQATIRALVRARLVESAHDLSDGGLAVALSECCFGPNGIGADITLDSELAPEMLLFHEGPSRILVSTSQPEAVLAEARKNSVKAVEIGVTLKARVVVRNRTETYFDSMIEDLKLVWSESLNHLLHSPVLVADA